MTSNQIEEINKIFRKRKEIIGAFVGDKYSWDTFFYHNRKNIKWCTKRRFELKNGDIWCWIDIEKNHVLFKGTAFNSIMLPKSLDYELFYDYIIPYLHYCTEIKWYEITVSIDKGE